MTHVQEKARAATLGGNLARTEERIVSACQRAGRERQEVTLVAVTKTRTTTEIEAAYDLGVRHFGENRADELEEKVTRLSDSFIGDPPLWHMIGHVQGRQARAVVASASIVHSLDSLRLARRMDRFLAEQGRTLPVLLEVNLSGEGAKYGFRASDPEGYEAFAAMLPELRACEHLEIRGLMTMAPIVPSPELARPVFRGLRELRDRLRHHVPDLGWDELSMGMTDDFEVAIEEGATMVRIGRAIFGPRD